MVMTDVSGSSERADALGKLGVSYGVGMVVGPTVGGYVTTLRSEQFAAGVAAVLCIVAMIIVLFFVPRSTKNLSDLKVKKQHGRYPYCIISNVIFPTCHRVGKCMGP